MELFDFFDPIFYTEKEADDIRIVTSRMFESDARFLFRLANKREFFSTLEKALIDNDQEYWLSFRRIRDDMFSLHLDPHSGYVNLGRFEFEPEMFTALYLEDKEAFIHYAVDQATTRFFTAMKQVSQKKYKYDVKVADKSIRKRFDLRNFPEVTVLNNVRLPQGVYDMIRDAKLDLERVKRTGETTAKDEVIAVWKRFGNCWNFADEMESLYRRHVECKKEQVAFFQPYLEGASGGQCNGKLHLRRVSMPAGVGGSAGRSGSSLFCIRTNRNIALDFQEVMDMGSLCKMRSRFGDMIIATAMSIAQNFEKNCSLDEGLSRVPSLSASQ